MTAGAEVVRVNGRSPDNRAVCFRSISWSDVRGDRELQWLPGESKRDGEMTGGMICLSHESFMMLARGQERQQEDKVKTPRQAKLEVEEKKRTTTPIMMHHHNIF